MNNELLPLKEKANMHSNATRTPLGAGKYENTLNWLIQNAPEGTQYPHVKRPQAIFFVATREEVENRDISRFMAKAASTNNIYNSPVSFGLMT